MKFTLPMPPSINQTYGVDTRDGKKHHLFKKRSVKDWEEDAGWEIRAQQMNQKKNMLFGNIAMKIRWLYRINRDIDAGIKVLLDVFQKQGIYQNDRQVRHLEVDISESGTIPQVEVEINEMD